MIKRSNNQFFLKTLSAFIICFFLSFTTGAQGSVQDPKGLETSIALLLIKTEDNIIFQDPYFELLDLDDYLLIPVNYLASQLDLDLSYYRSENKVVLTNNLNQKQAAIYWEEQLYQIDNKLFLSSEPPLFLNSDVFVSIAFLESFLEAEINWDFGFQALTINAPEDLFKESPNARRAGKQQDIDEKVLPPEEGPPFALSSIRYQFGVEHREKVESHETLDGFFKLRLDGYAGEWALSAAGLTGYDFYDHLLEPELTLLRAKYHKENELIVIGNAEVELAKTFGHKEIWGALYMTPDRQYCNEVIAYTDVSGPAAAGDQVLIYVNDLLWNNLQLATDGLYLFRDVPLRINRVNRIRVEVRKLDGETIVSTKEVAASPRILKEAGSELLISSGFYKRIEMPEWEGAMVGYRQRLAITENISFDQETAVHAPYVENPEQGFIGADTGVAFRLNKNLICTLDWLIGGEIEKDVSSGLQTSILYCLENGYFEGLVYYIPNPITKGVDTQTGQGVKILSEHELKKDLIFNAEGYLSESTPESRSWSLDGANLMLTKRFGGYNQNSLAGGLGKEWSTKEVEAGTLEADETSATVKYRVRERTVGANAETEYVDTEYLFNNNGPYLLQNLNTKSDLTLSVTSNFLLGLALDTVNTWYEQTYRGLRLHGETDAKWYVTNNTLLIGNVTLQGRNYPQTDQSFQIQQQKTGLYLQHFFTPELNMFGELNRILESPFYTKSDQYLYTTSRLGLNYHITDKTVKIRGNIGYRSPVGSRTHPQWSYGLTLEKYLPSAFLLELAFERLYDTLWDQNPEHIIRLCVSRALSFSDGKIKPYRYTEDDVSARIGGVVYLDINANGWFDEGDKALAGIKILVDGRIAVTDENGEYIFSSLPPGIYRVDFHLPSLPANYTPVTGPQLIRLRDQENFFVDFAVTVNGTVSGKVFIDRNDNGRQDENEKALSWVEVILDNGQQSVFTDADGSFYFEGVALGAHTLTLDPQSLPPGLQVTGHDVKTVSLTEEALEITDLPLPLIEVE